MQRLLGSKSNFTNNLGFVCQGVRCPVCRQYTTASDVYFIDNNKDKEQEEVSKVCCVILSCSVIYCTLKTEWVKLQNCKNCCIPNLAVNFLKLIIIK